MENRAISSWRTVGGYRAELAECRRNDLIILDFSALDPNDGSAIGMSGFERVMDRVVQENQLQQDSMALYSNFETGCLVVEKVGFSVFLNLTRNGKEAYETKPLEFIETLVWQLRQAIHQESIEPIASSPESSPQ